MTIQVDPKSPVLKKLVGFLHLQGICLRVSHVCRWVLLEVLDKVSPRSVNWKQATKPPIKMPFRKVENCNQVVGIGKQLKFSLVNVAGNDIVQGNKKLILGKSTLVVVKT